MSKLKKFIVALSTSAVLMGGGVLAAAPAEAATVVKIYYIYSNDRASGTRTCYYGYPARGSILSQWYNTTRFNWETKCRVVYNTATPV